nr:vegetative cell wall protein gp1-like [Aegilops tauschii subsp. strangulata]
MSLSPRPRSGSRLDTVPPSPGALTSPLRNPGSAGRRARAPRRPATLLRWTSRLPERTPSLAPVPQPPPRLDTAGAHRRCLVPPLLRMSRLPSSSPPRPPPRAHCHFPAPQVRPDLFFSLPRCRPSSLELVTPRGTRTLRAPATLAPAVPPASSPSGLSPPLRACVRIRALARRRAPTPTAPLLDLVPSPPLIGAAVPLSPVQRARPSHHSPASAFAGALHRTPRP